MRFAVTVNEVLHHIDRTPEGAHNAQMFLHLGCVAFVNYDLVTRPGFGCLLYYVYMTHFPFL